MRTMSFSFPRVRSRRQQIGLIVLGVLVSLVPALRAAAGVWPEAEWLTAKPAEVGLAEARLNEARDYALTGGMAWISAPNFGEKPSRMAISAATTNMAVE